MSGKSFFIDLSRCTACRGCQVACKQWKQKPAEKTANTGSHQNPPDLSAATLKLVRFKETAVGGDFKWLFFPDQCRHCLDSPCKLASDPVIQDAIVQDPDTGAVVFTEKTKGLDINLVRPVCPYDIPRVDPVTKIMYKCDMCLDRVRSGMLPACVKTCPTGAMNFGDRQDVLAMAAKRLGALAPRYPQAALIDARDVRAVYLTLYPVRQYHAFVQAAEAAPGNFSRRSALALLGGNAPRTRT
ncbi:MAG: formate dehydrogenase [Desulfovibrionaceae bacterium]|nr:formate dehydrogenase [Desulfovibrionaceae bacterium]MBF0513416.1 formate dehydrogenase [Desulfovibrionaceae bacterium]